MPGFYQPKDYELVGFIVGMVDRPKLLDGSRIRVGDVLVGLPSAGLHTNGYSLARRILFDKLELGLEDRLPGADEARSVGELLLAPHLSYLPWLRPWLGDPRLHGLAHITGGGLTDNVPRILPAGTAAHLRLGSWEIPELFGVLAREGAVEDPEMLRVFNLGVGMVLAVDPSAIDDLLQGLPSIEGRSAWVLGEVVAGDGAVHYEGRLWAGRLHSR